MIQFQQEKTFSVLQCKISDRYIVDTFVTEIIIIKSAGNFQTIRPNNTKINYTGELCFVKFKSCLTFSVICFCSEYLHMYLHNLAQGDHFSAQSRKVVPTALFIHADHLLSIKTFLGHYDLVLGFLDISLLACILGSLAKRFI